MGSFETKPKVASCRQHSYLPDALKPEAPAEILQREEFSSSQYCLTDSRFALGKYFLPVGSNALLQL